MQIAINSVRKIPVAEAAAFLGVSELGSISTAFTEEDRRISRLDGV